MQLVFLNSVKHWSEAFIEAYFNSKILLLHNTSQLGAHWFLFEVRMFFPPCITFIYPECNLPFYCLVIHSPKVLQWAFVLKTLNSLVSSEGCHLTVQVLLQVTCEYVKQIQDKVATAVHLWPLCYKYCTLTATPCAASLTSYSFQDIWSSAITTWTAFCQKPSRNPNRLCQPEDLLHKF